MALNLARSAVQLCADQNKHHSTTAAINHPRGQQNATDDSKQAEM